MRQSTQAVTQFYQFLKAFQVHNDPNTVVSFLIIISVIKSNHIHEPERLAPSLGHTCSDIARDRFCHTGNAPSTRQC
jgi:hypothetical protein